IIQSVRSAAETDPSGSTVGRIEAAVSGAVAVQAQDEVSSAAHRPFGDESCRLRTLSKHLGYRSSAAKDAINIYIIVVILIRQKSGLLVARSRIESSDLQPNAGPARWE